MASSVCVPRADSKVYKDECGFCFHSTEHGGGLFVNMKSFEGFCKRHLEVDHKKTGQSLYLHCHRVRRPVADGTGQEIQEPVSKLTKLAIGMPGGAQNGPQHEFEDTWQVFNFSTGSYTSITDAAVPADVKEAADAIIKVPSAFSIAETASLTSIWDGEMRTETKFKEIVQVDNRPRIPPSGWKCQANDCDITKNLWLNLSSGKILCGRQYADGSGGRNHAVQHYECKEGGPLAVKLGTITVNGADVWSYAEDDMVIDPNLATHLKHFGIDMSAMEKTEKTMLELELEMNKSREWNAITESGSTLTPVYGPGFTGLINMGNTCYMNSVIQMMLSVSELNQYFTEKAAAFFSNSSGSAEDLGVQIAKMACGLFSGDYSKPPQTESDKLDQQNSGIRPVSFWALVGKGHHEFSTKKQQDAHEYLLHLMDKIERLLPACKNLLDLFHFEFEERFQCNASQTVRYSHFKDNFLSLPLPLELATNKAEYDAFIATNPSQDDANRIRMLLKLEDCIGNYFEQVTVPDYFSTVAKQKTTATKSIRFGSYPQYLLVHLQKFYVSDDWKMMKKDVEMIVPDVLDLEKYRGKGLQPGEVSMPDDEPAVNTEHLSALTSMGFPDAIAKKALHRAKNFDDALDLLMSGAPIEDPEPRKPSAMPIADPAKIAELLPLGFTEYQATVALEKCGGDSNRAAEYLFEHSGEIAEETVEVTVPVSQESTSINDGPDAYELIGFISHMGSSVHNGHYVCHLLKNNRWTIFNDEKVAYSEKPPKSFAYIYLYKRKNA